MLPSEVAYVHQTRDRDGDVVLLFRNLVAVFDAECRGDLVSVVVATANTVATTTMALAAGRAPEGGTGGPGVTSD